MRDIRPGLFAFLAADAAIGALVTAGGISRIYPVLLPQGIKLASIVYTRISGAGDYKMEGVTGYSRPRYQIAAWAPTNDVAVTLANLIKDAIDGYSGVWGSGANAVAIQGVFCADQREMYDDIVQMHGAMRDYLIHHGEL